MLFNSLTGLCSASHADWRWNGSGNAAFASAIGPFRLAVSSCPFSTYNCKINHDTSTLWYVLPLMIR